MRADTSGNVKRVWPSIKTRKRKCLALYDKQKLDGQKNQARGYPKKNQREKKNLFKKLLALSARCAHVVCSKRNRKAAENKREQKRSCRRRQNGNEGRQMKTERRSQCAKIRRGLPYGIFSSEKGDTKEVESGNLYKIVQNTRLYQRAEEGSRN